MTHTPGPWKINRRNPCRVYLRPGIVIAVTLQDNFPEAEANARLIAAAPDLLAALVAITTYHPSAGEEVWLQNCKLARAAIAKATGAKE
mgnify:CR=1 FL=1